MAIYQLFDEQRQDEFTETFDGVDPHPAFGGAEPQKSGICSSLLTRFCFFLLLLANLGWFVYVSSMLVVATLLSLLSWRKSRLMTQLVRHYLLQCRRAILFAVALLIGLFSPPFGVMIACTYFLMYDKKGMEEVVPAPLQAQFKGFFREKP